MTAFGESDMQARLLIVAVALVAGCGGVETRVAQADPLIAGRSYAHQPISLGAVKMHVSMLDQVLESHSRMVSDPEQIDVVLGFVATGDVTSVVAGSGALKSKKDGSVAELVARYQARGSSLECVAETGAELSADYWFNGSVKPEQWKCVVLRFHLAGHQALDPLELSFDPVNVGGEVQRLLPVGFVLHAEVLKAD